MFFTIPLSRRQKISEGSHGVGFEGFWQFLQQRWGSHVAEAASPPLSRFHAAAIYVRPQSIPLRSQRPHPFGSAIVSHKTKISLSTIFAQSWPLTASLLSLLLAVCCLRPFSPLPRSPLSLWLCLTQRYRQMLRISFPESTLLIVAPRLHCLWTCSRWHWPR